MSPLSGWYAFRVICNQSLIASFPTNELAEAFVRDRAARWPRNEYRIV
jgi:hypothetical protein